MSCATTNKQSHSTKKPNNIPLIFVNEFLIDTGSKYTIVPKYFKHKDITSTIYPENKKSENINLMAANGSIIKTYGKCMIKNDICGKTYQFEAIIGDVLQPIIGTDFFINNWLRFINRSFMWNVKKKEHGFIYYW